jgi:hypothetical protein
MLLEWKGDKENVTSIAFSSDGLRLASAGWAVRPTAAAGTDRVSSGADRMSADRPGELADVADLPQQVQATAPALRKRSIAAATPMAGRTPRR